MKNKSTILSIVIVNWNSWHHIHRCLNSIAVHAENIEHEIIVIDNNSSDKSVHNLKKLHPSVRLFDLQDNVGFPKGNNIGFSKARGKYILALNPDTEIFADTLQSSISVLENDSGYGCVGVKSLKVNGRIQYACARKFVTLKGAIFESLMFDKLFPWLRFLDSPNMTYWDHDDDRDIDMTHGAYMMFPKKVYDQIGGFDDRIPMFYEDHEFCLRLREKGYKLRYIAEVKIIHYIGESVKKAPADWIIKLRYESIYLAIKKWQGQSVAKQYPYWLSIALSLKFFLVPFLGFGLYIKNGYHNIPTLFHETIYGFAWIVDHVYGKQVTHNTKD